MTPRSVVPTPDLATRFRVVEVFSGGEGWSGLVEEPDRPERSRAVLKVLEAGQTPSEVSLLTSLDHPAIPHILEVGQTEDGRAFLLREHVEGRPLGSDFPLAPANALQLAVELLEILAFVHLRGVLHLDIKPANIIRRPNGEHALLDFGLSRRRGDPATGGSLLFAAPERFLGAAADERSDLYSVGALLAYALDRSSGGIRSQGFRQRLLDTGFFAATGIDAAALPPPFDRVLPALLDRDPGRRPYPDARALIESLSGQGGRPPLAALRPDPVFVHAEAIARMRRTLASAHDVTLRGEDEETRLSLALHVAAEIRPDSPPRVHSREQSTAIELHGDGDTTTIELPELDPSAVAEHLVLTLAVPPEYARSIAASMRNRGAHSVAGVATILEDLVASGRIVPDGVRWIWPDAMSGRIDDEAAIPDVSSPTELAALAASGRVEAALRQHRTRDFDTAAEESEWTLALAEGLLAAGQPGSALPFASLDPVLHARALFDLGQIDRAARRLDSASSPARHRDRERLAATIEHVRGEARAAHRRMQALIEDRPSPAERITYAWTLLGIDENDAARAVVEPLVRADVEPFLQAAVQTCLGECLRRAGDLGAADSAYESARRVLLELGHARHAATAATSLGTLARERGDLEQAVAHHRDAHALFEHVGDDRGIALSIANLGSTSLELGDFPVAVDRLQDALRRFDAIGLGLHRSLVEIRLARALLGTRDLDGARRHLATATALGIPSNLQPEAEALSRALALGESGPLPAVDSTENDPMPSDTGNGSVSREIFRTFVAVNRRLAAESDLERAMTHILDTAIALTGGRSGYLLIERGGGLRREVSAGADGDQSLAYSRSMANRAVQQQHVLRSEDVLHDRDLADMPSVQNLRERSAICVPIRSADGNVGAIYVEHAGRAGVFDDHAAEHLEVLADQAAIAVDRMVRSEQLEEELETSRRELTVAKRATKRKTTEMIGDSPAMAGLRTRIEKVADSELPVLVHGETGTGKELVARALHDGSARARNAFVPLNCSAIPEQLMESELFGHKKGSFTGADADRVGLLEVASGGTLFLDEIGDMPLALQAKLLRALQEREIRRIGDSAPIAIDTRVVSATHKNLLELSDSGEFRRDLYYRLVAVELTVPPLRDRDGDIEQLAQTFLTRLNREHRRSIRWSGGALSRLGSYSWPGNVRELHHVVSRAFLLADGDQIVDVQLPDSTPETAASTRSAWPVLTLREAENRTITAALDATSGDKTKAAKLLGISRTALYDKLRRQRDREE